MQILCDQALGGLNGVYAAIGKWAELLLLAGAFAEFFLLCLAPICRFRSRCDVVLLGDRGHSDDLAHVARRQGTGRRGVLRDCDDTVLLCYRNPVLIFLGLLLHSCIFWVSRCIAKLFACFLKTDKSIPYTTVSLPTVPYLIPTTLPSHLQNKDDDKGGSDDSKEGKKKKDKKAKKSEGEEEEVQ